VNAAVDHLDNFVLRHRRRVDGHISQDRELPVSDVVQPAVSPTEIFRGGRDIALDDHLVLRHVREQRIGYELVAVT
jgi:hypothetical protein